MKNPEEARRILYNMGFQHGVYDHDRNQHMTVNEADFGNLYLEGYRDGHNAALTRKWYVVSIDEYGKPNAWYVDGNGEMNSWVNTQEEATAYCTEEKARDKSMHCNSALGRGNYSVVWI